MIRQIFLCTVTLAVLSLFVSCKSGQRRSFKDLPKDKQWIVKEGAAFSLKENKRNFFTVGSVEITGSISSAREDAHFQAKTEMAGKIKSYTTRFMKRYSERYADHFKKKNSIDENITQAMAKDVAEATLSNYDFIDHYVDHHGKSERTMYTLLRMPRESFNKALMQSIKRRAMTRLRIKADDFEKKMDEELRKSHQREAEALKRQ